MGNRDFCSFFCEFLLPASSASSLRSAPGGIVAAPEQPFLAAQALSPCDAARTTGCGILSQPRWAGFLPLSRRSVTKTDAPVVSRFLYRLTPTFVYCTLFGEGKNGKGISFFSGLRSTHCKREKQISSKTSLRRWMLPESTTAFRGNAPTPQDKICGTQDHRQISDICVCSR